MIKDPDNILNNFHMDYSSQGGSPAMYSLLLFEHARADVYHYDCREISIQEAGRQFRREIRYREHIAGILLFSAGVTMELEEFLVACSGGHRNDIPIIGAEAGARGTPYLFGNFVEDHGIAAIILSGRHLSMHYDYDLGWKPIGKDMKITGMDGPYCVSTIDDMPAVSIYQRYLGVDPDEYFVENVREFPLIKDMEERRVVRCPTGYDRDGRLYFIATLQVGETVRLSYANPRRLLEDTGIHAGEMKRFAPQCLLTIICENRARFLGQLTQSDLASYTAFAPQMAHLRGYAAVMVDRQGGGVVNSAILTLGLREGPARGGARGIDAEAASARRRESAGSMGAIPLNERLAMFLEQTTKELEDMAVAADAANAAKSSFLSNMSHEIRTPINAILGMNEMILRESSEKDIISYAQNIRTAGLGLLGIIRGILDFSKIEAGKIDILCANYEVSSLMNDVYNLIRLRAEEKSLELILEVDPHIPHVLYGDEMRIKQIITNLMTNAVKYTEHGTVHLTMGYTRRDEESITLHVSVRDTGIGIRPEDLSKLFNAFDRIDWEMARKVEGTGLGLNITQELLARMGSGLKVESTYGEGSCFSFSLVQTVKDWRETGDIGLADDNATPSEVSGTSFVAPRARILVVDDAPMNLLVITGLLKRTKVRVDTAGSGQECLDAFGRNAYDLVFLDHRMPGMDGLETMEKLQDLYPERLSGTPVISLTANAVSGARERYLAAGFSDYLTKPVMVKKLEEVMIRFLPPDKVFLVNRDAGDGDNGDTGDNNTGASQLPEALFQVQGLDTQQGLGFCGSADAYLDALEIFQSSAAARAEEIEQLYKQGDWAGYTIRVHALKSMARSVGAAALSSLAERLENAGDAGDLDTIQADTGSLLGQYRQMGQHLGQALSRAADADSGLPDLPTDEFEEAIQSVRDLAVAFDYESIKMIMDELNHYRVPAEYEILYNVLSEAVARADWDEITEALQRPLGGS